MEERLNELEQDIWELPGAGEGVAPVARKQQMNYSGARETPTRQLLSEEAGPPSWGTAASSREVTRAIMRFSELDIDDELLEDGADDYDTGESGEERRRNSKNSDKSSLSNTSDPTGSSRPKSGYRRQVPQQEHRHPRSNRVELPTQPKVEVPGRGGIGGRGGSEGTVGTNRTPRTQNTSAGRAVATNLTGAVTGSSSHTNLDRRGIVAVPSSLTNSGIKLLDSQKHILLLDRQRQKEGSGTSRGAGDAPRVATATFGTSKASQDQEQAVREGVGDDMRSRRMSNSQRRQKHQPQHQQQQGQQKDRQQQRRRPASRTTSRPTQQRQSAARSSPSELIQSESVFTPSTIQGNKPPNDHQIKGEPDVKEKKRGSKAQEVSKGMDAAKGTKPDQPAAPTAQEEKINSGITKRKSLSDSIDSIGIDSGGDVHDTAEVNVTEARIYVGRDISTQLSVASSITESYAVGSSNRHPPADSLEAISVASSIARGNSNRRGGRGRGSGQDDNAGKGSHETRSTSVSDAESLHRAQVEDWLTQQCLERYSVRFIEEGYDSLDRIKYLDMRELERMEVLPGHRRSLMRAVQVLRRQVGGSKANLPQISEDPTLDAANSNNAIMVPKRTVGLNKARQSLRNEEHRLQRRISSMKSKRRGMTTRPSSRSAPANAKKTGGAARNVRFSSAEVRTYERMYSDNPSVSAVSGGPPVGIGWSYNPRLTYRFSVMSAQHQRSTEHNHGYCPILSREEREACLREAGFTAKDIAQFTREARKAKSQRRTTVQNASFGPTAEIEEKIESIGRAIKSVIKPEKKLMNPTKAA